LVWRHTKVEKMAMKAVGWISQSLGWNISGRGEGKVEEGQPAPAPAVSSPTAVDAYLAQVSSVVFGTGSSANAATSSSSNPFSGEEDIEKVELDEQGLPKSRNWYYYDEALGRWNVSPDAPKKVKDEHAERLRQEEEERNKLGRFPDPPPPPPPAFNPAAFTAARSPLVPQYAVPTYFDKQD
jgi:hypothetical protein